MTDPKPWCDGPFELLSSSLTGDTREAPATGTRKVASEMALVHNLIIRGINAIYLQSRGVGERGTEADKLDFTNFALRWARFVDEHHHSEEAHIFPSIEKTAGAPGLMEGNVTEHAAFHDGVETFRAYLEAVVAGREAFDAGTVRGLVDGFMPTLRTHLAGEIQTLLALERYEDRADWGAWFEASVKEMVDGQMKSAQYRYEILALAFVLHDKTFEGGVWEAFPPGPWIVVLGLRWLFMRRHAAWWRFAGCGFDSMPRELPFG